MRTIRGGVLKACVVGFPCVDSTRLEVAVLNTVLAANNETFTVGNRMS